MNGNSGHALYLYALSTPATRPHLHLDMLSEVMGPIHVEACHEFIAVVGFLPDLTAWQDDVNTASIDWVTSRAIHHARVIEHVWRRGPVYPARFGTLFTSRSSLAEHLAAHRAPIHAFLAGTSGFGEWDIKLFFDPDDMEARWINRELGKEAGNLVTLPAGRRYLAEQRLRREVSRTITQDLVTHCQALAEDLAATEAGFRERPLPPARDGQHRPLAHWAILWPLTEETHRQERLAVAAEAQADCGIDLQWTGPWPPYTFRPQLPDCEF